MGLMARITSVFKAKANRLVERHEDPREMLDLSYEHQLELLQQVRRGLADVATSRKRLELQAERLDASANKNETQARDAIGLGREDLARAALTRRAGALTELSELARQRDALAEQQTKLEGALQRLETKVAAFRTRKETLKATYTAAEAQTRIGEAVAGISEERGDVGYTIQRAEDRVEQMQARASAIDGLLDSGALDDLTLAADPIQAELDRLGAHTEVELELARLKGEAPQLEAGSVTPALERGDR